MREIERKEGGKDEKEGGTVRSPRMTALEAESTAISELLIFSDPLTKTLGTSIRISPRREG